MKNFYLVCNSNKDINFTFTNRVVNYLESHGAVCKVGGFSGEDDSASPTYTQRKQVPEDTECILVVGGDGTFIHAARDLFDLKIPFFGINMGTLGYLTEADGSDVEPALDCLLQDRWFLEERMLLSGSVERDHQVVYEDFAFNDAVFSRSGALQIFHYQIHVNGEFLVEFPADGIIVATPTGSTAYNYSAGGPIVMPHSSLLVITPICAHSGNSRSIILPSDLEVDVHILEKERKKESRQMVSFDGDSVFELQPGDKIHISASKQTIPIARINKVSFLETLRHKLR